MFQNIFEYIDRLVALVRPRALVYMAIDGVAPRAKMNQQRSRRFRAAQEREEQRAIESKLRVEFKSQGIVVPEKDDGDTFDSNVITPGTEFMDRLAMALQWCALRGRAGLAAQRARLLLHCLAHLLHFASAARSGAAGVRLAGRLVAMRCGCAGHVSAAHHVTQSLLLRSDVVVMLCHPALVVLPEQAAACVDRRQARQTAYPHPFPKHACSACARPVVHTCARVCRYVHKRLNEHPGWRPLTVVLSDANTPGEGEHKFMQFLREQRGRPGWDPNTCHCVYGLDADLIHLALASHEPHFYILREVVFPPKPQGGRDGRAATAAVYEAAMAQHNSNNNSNNADAAAGGEVKAKREVARKPYQFLRIAVLREYLGLEFSDLALPFPWDLERVIDDFVFMCFFVGNDFLPHMPTLDIREQGIELMMHVYRRALPALPGYLCSGAFLSTRRVSACVSAWVAIVEGLVEGGDPTFALPSEPAFLVNDLPLLV